MNDEQRYKRARARVDALKGFYSHLAVYLMVNAGLFLINVLTFSDWWFYWPLLGWGIGLTAHALAVFVIGDALGPGWEERKINQYMGEASSKDVTPSQPTQATSVARTSSTRDAAMLENGG